VNLRDGSNSFYSQAGGAAGTRTNSGSASTAGGDGWVTITWVVPTPLPTPQTPVANIESREPVVFEFSMPAGMQCDAPRSDSSGAWVQLPAADQCSLGSSPRSGPTPELVGWATTPDFPVAIAQRQVDKGWGAYELTNESGELTAVFIPASGWSQASGNTSLYPIWA